jgi:hypothetical protein
MDGIWHQTECNLSANQNIDRFIDNCDTMTHFCDETLFNFQICN